VKTFLFKRLIMEAFFEVEADGIFVTNTITDDNRLLLPAPSMRRGHLSTSSPKGTTLPGE